MNKTEIIESLYKAGKITFEEAMTLASGSSEHELSLCDGAIAGQTAIKELNKVNFISGIVDPHYENDPDEGPVLVSLDIDACVSLMKHKGHTWHDHVTGADKEVTVDMLKDYLRTNIRKCLDGFLVQNAEEKIDDYFIVDSGGYLIVCRWDDEEMTTIQCEVMYVPERNSNFIKYEDVV